MKRFHVHLHVDDLARSIGFYSTLFAAEPTRVEADYAKWMLDDPRINFAISTRGSRPGIDHLGFQTDDPEELAGLRARAEAADLALLDEGDTTCCYARSEKHWVTDPQGIAWEHFHTLGSIPVFNEPSAQGQRLLRPGGARQAGGCPDPVGRVLLLKGRPVRRGRVSRALALSQSRAAVMNGSSAGASAPGWPHSFRGRYRASGHQRHGPHRASGPACGAGRGTASG